MIPEPVLVALLRGAMQSVLYANSHSQNGKPAWMLNDLGGISLWPLVCSIFVSSHTVEEDREGGREGGRQAGRHSGVSK